FVGWGVFVCMGLSFYVLVKIIDAPLHSPIIPKISYWIFMVAVFMIVYATLFGNFAASWVFLYPLALQGGNQWGDTETMIWLIGVLLAGVAIILNNLEILLTVRKAGFSIIDALGFEAIKPKPKAGYKVPTPLVPLVVNAVGMIIATIPFAVLLVFMMADVQSGTESINPLLAKNVLWWFGHPVVYALLFPAAAFGYYMVERLTNAKLIGERPTKLSWLVATVIQNFIGSHHVYMDYVQILPIHIMMQLFTYGITIPSLASLFAIIGQIWVKDFEWSLSAKYLVLALFGWVLAGLSGVVNATLVTNQLVHNTLWVVAHFHAMALLNITMMMFGAIYFLVQDYSGREVYDKKLAEYGMWAKYIGTLGFVHMWFVQGIMGSIRRRAISSPGYGLLTWLSIPFGLLILIGFWISTYVLWKTLTGPTAAEEPTKATA
ncbi:MAG: cbb3-type cytochrome c oxidase subunit I, partial [Candidatus Kariarchaeaceae archaeon]